MNSKKDKPQIQSIFVDILDDLKKEADMEKVRAKCLERVRNSKVNDVDKQSMTNLLTRYTADRLWKLVYDLILKYEGNGVLK